MSLKIINNLAKILSESKDTIEFKLGDQIVLTMYFKRSRNILYSLDYPKSRDDYYKLLEGSIFRFLEYKNVIEELILQMEEEVLKTI